MVQQNLKAESFLFLLLHVSTISTFALFNFQFRFVFFFPFESFSRVLFWKTLKMIGNLSIFTKYSVMKKEQFLNRIHHFVYCALCELCNQQLSAG